MSLEQIYNNKNPWPEHNAGQVLFILDARNSAERDILKNWIQHHGSQENKAFAQLWQPCHKVDP